MNPSDEADVRRCWQLLKQDIDVGYFVTKLHDAGVFDASQKQAVLDTQKGDTKLTKADRFLETVLKSGAKCYQTMCNILLENKNDPKYENVIKALGIQSSGTPDSGIAMSTAQRQDTIVSVDSTTSSLSLRLGACAENLPGDHDERMVSARAPWRDDMPRKGTSPRTDVRPKTPIDAVQQAVLKASDANSGQVDMATLEKELLKFAPKIADLFNKINAQTSTVATSETELTKIKNDNDRLRKTNRTLVEKLNSFQQKIIQLQLENKKLREVNDNEKIKHTQIEDKSTELEKLKEKLIEQKTALIEKEKDLDLQLAKLESVITDNEEQKLKMANLEALHEEGVQEYEDQQYQIEELQKEKDQQKEQIEVLEDKQKMSELILYRLEERLINLEKCGQQRGSRTRPRYMGTRPWMNGMMAKSHHANVKLQPQFPTDWSSSGITGKGRGWNM